MKKLLFLSVLFIFAINGMKAQITPNTGKTKTKGTVAATPSKISEPIQSEPKSSQPAPPPPPPPPAPVRKEAPTTTEAPVYGLTSVRVKIRTGNDNKEFPSKVYSTLMAKSTPANWRNYFQWNLTNEMRVNSETEFGMEIAGAPITLQAFQSQGLKLTVSYEPNFFADAWKIENISLVLEFKDQHGNLHPTLGNKTIMFTTAYGFLNGEYHNIDCFTDGSFTPMTSVIRK